VRTFAIVNQKGGCGKTTTAINLAAIFARRGQRTLLIDMDPQSHCAAGLGVPEDRIEFSIGEAMTAPDHAEFSHDDLLWEVSRNFDLAPSTTRLAALEAPGGGLHQLPDRDRRLESVLNRLRHRYDIAIIDCPPNIGLLTFNALRAAREAIIPIETGYFSLRGAEKQWKTIQRIIDRLNRPIICHMVPTLYDPQSRIARELLQQLQRQFAGQLVDAPIHEHESIREATSFGQPIIEYAPDSPAHRDFETLADWLEDHSAGRNGWRIDVTSPRLVAAYPRRNDREHDENGGHGPDDHTQPARRHAPASSPQTGTGVHCPTRSSRAAELVERVRDLRKSVTDPAGSHTGTSPTTPAVLGLTTVRPARPAVHFGVNQTATGTIFCQPHSIGREIHVVGDFNGWSPVSDRLHYHEGTKTWQVTLPLAPGTHRYMLVVDGVWQTDSYNDSQSQTDDGRPCSEVTIEPQQDRP
jgi:chromosome partitioning protein